MYNGHPSYAAWNVSLWIGNDESLYQLARECIRRNRTRDQAAREMLAYLPERTPDGVPYTLTNVRRAMVGL